MVFFGKLFFFVFMNVWGYEYWMFFIKFISLFVVIIDKDIKNVILRRYNLVNGIEIYKVD